MRVVSYLGEPIDPAIVGSYFDLLIGRLFKILPLRERNEPALGLYIRGLQRELSGLGDYIPSVKADASVLSIIAILQVYAESPQSSLEDVRRDVFSAIGVCGKLRQQYIESGVDT